MKRKQVLLLLEIIAKGNAGHEPYDSLGEGDSYDDTEHKQWEEEWTAQYETYVSFLEELE